MAKFDSFKFLNARSVSADITDEDLKTFEPFMTLLALSMSKSGKMIAHRLNTKKFYALPKDVQCMAMTGLDGKKYYGKWAKSKKSYDEDGDTARDATKAYVEKIMYVCKCSHNDAVHFAKYGLVNREEIEEIYEKISKPCVVKVKKKRKNADVE